MSARRIVIPVRVLFQYFIPPFPSHPDHKSVHVSHKHVHTSDTANSQVYYAATSSSTTKNLAMTDNSRSACAHDNSFAIAGYDFY